LDKSSIMLLMLIVILFCARLSGFMDVLFLSILSATLLTYYVLPPTRSLEIANPKDRLSVVVFIVAALLATFLIRGNLKLNLFRTSNGPLDRRT
jgi:K+-sensing histidine kinase KdpD